MAAWVERNNEHQVELVTRLVEAALPCDFTATMQIAKWVYRADREGQRAGVGDGKGLETSWS